MDSEVWPFPNSVTSAVFIADTSVPSISFPRLFSRRVCVLQSGCIRLNAVCHQFEKREKAPGEIVENRTNLKLVRVLEVRSERQFFYVAPSVN